MAWRYPLNNSDVIWEKEIYHEEIQTKHNLQWICNIIPIYHDRTSFTTCLLSFQVHWWVLNLFVSFRQNFWRELIQSHPTSHPQHQRKRRTHTKFDLRPRKTRTVIRMNNSFPNRSSFSYPDWKTAATSIFTYFLFQITKQNTTGSIMGNWYSADHIAKDHMHTDKTCNTEEPQQKCRLGTVSNRLLAGGGGGGGKAVKRVLLDPNPRP